MKSHLITLVIGFAVGILTYHFAGKTEKVEVVTTKTEWVHDTVKVVQTVKGHAEIKWITQSSVDTVLERDTVYQRLIQNIETINMDAVLFRSMDTVNVHVDYKPYPFGDYTVTGRWNPESYKKVTETVMIKESPWGVVAMAGINQSLKPTIAIGIGYKFNLKMPRLP